MTTPTPDPAPPALTAPHQRTTRYRVGDRVLLEASDQHDGVLPSSPYVGAVVATTPDQVHVLHQHQPMGDAPLAFRRRGGAYAGLDVGGPTLRLLGRADKPVAPLDNAGALVLQQQLLALAMVVSELPLDRLLAYLDRTHALGPTLDPTGYATAERNLRAVGDLAVALQPFQAVALRLANTAD